MELVELRSMEDKKEASAIRSLMSKGFITKYVLNGYAAYDPKELETYRKTRKLGRPIKDSKNCVNIKQD